MILGNITNFQIDNRILVCTMAAYHGQVVPSGVNKLIRSCLKRNIQLRLFGVDKVWQNMFATKLVHLYECLYYHRNDYDWVFCTDAADVIWVRDLAATFAVAVQVAKGRGLWAAEQNCFPDESLRNSYPVAPTPFRYLNAGCFFGSMSSVLTCLEAGTKLPNPRACDQLALTHCFLSGTLPMTLDYNQEVFGTLWGSPAYEGLWCLWTHNCPSIIHANGSSHDNPVYQFYE